MNEDKLAEKIRKLGYKSIFDHYSISNSLASILIIPKKMLNSSKGNNPDVINPDIVNLLKKYGFEFNSLILNSDVIKEVYNADILVVFKNMRDESK